MTDAPDHSADDWLNNPAPPPRSTDPAFAQDKPRKAPRRSGTVTPLRPIDQLADGLDAAPLVAGPEGYASENPGEGLDPPEASAPAPAEPAQPRGPDRPKREIWKGCPVTPLGVNGDFAYLLDTNQQMRAVKKIERSVIMSLFANRLPALCHNFPKWAKDPDSGAMYRRPGQFEGDAAAMAIYAACAEKGLFNPDGAVRGVGAWIDDDGALVYHTGDQLIIGGKALDPTLHQGKIYPAYPAIPHPAAGPEVTDAPERALETFASWNWTRPEIDPQLCLGMIGIQFLGGALAWRPTFWNTGARSSGKSTFQTLLKHLHGPGGLVQSTDTTKSGVTSRIGHSSLPVALDELEPGDEGSGKEKFLIELARVASSGGEWMRGSADQKGASGNVYSPFFFSSIIIPGALKSQDLSRLVILSLEALPETASAPSIRPEVWRKRGAAIKRLLIDRWPSWQARLDLWREAFAEQKITGRNADNYATIMAMAQMAQSAELPTSEELTGWTAKVARHVRASTEEIGSDADEIVTHLLSQQFDPMRRGERHTIAAWIKAAGHRPRAGRRLFGGAGTSDDPYLTSQDDAATLADHAKKANNSLASQGLRVIGTPEAPVLFVATKQLQGLKDLFSHSQWAGGAWTQSLTRIKGAKANCGPRYLDGQQTKGTEIPFTSMPGLLAFDGDEVTPSQPATDPIPLGMETY